MARYRISCTCSEDKVDELSMLILKAAGNAVVTQIDVVKVGTRIPPLPIAGGSWDDQGGVVVEPTTVRFKPRQTHTPGGAKWSTKEPGRIVLRLFDELTVAHPVDICTALKKAGYAPNSYGAICAGLIEEGMLYRSSRGAYRRPTSLEQAKVG